MLAKRERERERERESLRGREGDYCFVLLLSFLIAHVGCRDAVQWVCEFIESQSQQKPFLQTKSLHTSIVAGFITLIIWIMEHPHLLAHEVLSH